MLRSARNDGPEIKWPTANRSAYFISGLKTRPSAEAPASRREAEAGFTLIELLVVVLILSLIVAALTGGVRFAGRAWEAQERQIDEAGDFSAAQTVLRQLIESGHGFQGDSASLKFVGRLPHALNRSGFFDIEISNESDRLVLGWRPHFNGPGPKPALNETDLVKNVRGIDIGYYVSQANGAGQWANALGDKGKPPELIRLSLQVSGRHNWPPLIVASRVSPMPAAGQAAAGQAAGGQAAGGQAAGGTPTPAAAPGPTVPEN